MQKESINSRSEIILGKENIEYLSLKKIAVIGLGGVGSIIPLVLVRSNIRKIILIDNDFVNVSNLNRQIAYDLKDVGKIKVEALKGKLFALRDDLDIETFSDFINENFNFEVFKNVDFIVDCIDDLKAKVLLAKFALKNNINYISSMGTGNRLDPTKISITSLNKTSGDPLARKFRYLLRQENIVLKKINVACSSEEPIIKDRVISSMIFVPNATGLAIASFVLNKLLGRTSKWD